jgi:hypothetical protein
MQAALVSGRQKGGTQSQEDSGPNGTATSKTTDPKPVVPKWTTSKGLSHILQAKGKNGNKKKNEEPKAHQERVQELQRQRLKCAGDPCLKDFDRKIEEVRRTDESIDGNDGSSMPHAQPHRFAEKNAKIIPAAAVAGGAATTVTHRPLHFSEAKHMMRHGLSPYKKKQHNQRNHKNSPYPYMRFQGTNVVAEALAKEDAKAGAGAGAGASVRGEGDKLMSWQYFDPMKPPPWLEPTWNDSPSHQASHVSPGNGLGGGIAAGRMGMAQMAGRIVQHGGPVPQAAWPQFTPGGALVPPKKSHEGGVDTAEIGGYMKTYFPQGAHLNYQPFPTFF